jgi:hypothetical protein
MLAFYLFSHHFKSFIRNGQWRRNISSKILLGIVVLNVVFLFVSLGLHIDKLLINGKNDPISLFNSFLLWYLPADLLMRCFLQPLPTIQILPYLRFRIRRSKLINYLLIRSTWNWFNLIPWLVIIPFSIKLIVPAYGIGAALRYLAGFLLLVGINNYLAVLLGYLSQKKAIFFVLPLSLAILVFLLQQSGYAIQDLSTSFGLLLIRGHLAFFEALIITILWRSIHRLLLRNFYIDNIETKKKSRILTILRMDKSDQFNEVSRLILLEINLLLRNRRPRQTLLMLPIFVVYFSMMGFKNPHQGFMPLFLTTFTIGIGASIYGQFLFSWESSYFDGIMTRKNNLVNYVKAKYYLMSALALIVFAMLFTIFSVTGKFDRVLLFSVLLFTLGVMSFIIIFAATFNDGRIDLNKSQFFNYQGVKGNQFLLSFLMMSLPIGFYSLFKFLFNDTTGKLVIVIPGLLFIIFHEWWIKIIIVPRLIARKYKNLEGFRKLST